MYLSTVTNFIYLCNKWSQGHSNITAAPPESICAMHDFMESLHLVHSYGQYYAVVFLESNSLPEISPHVSTAKIPSMFFMASF